MTTCNYGSFSFEEVVQAQASLRAEIDEKYQQTDFYRKENLPNYSREICPIKVLETIKEEVKRTSLKETRLGYKSLTGTAFGYRSTFDKGAEYSPGKKILFTYKTYTSNKEHVDTICQEMIDAWKKSVEMTFKKFKKLMSKIEQNEKNNTWDKKYIPAETPPEKPPGEFDDIKVGDRVEVSRPFGGGWVAHTVTSTTKTRFVVGKRTFLKKKRTRVWNPLHSSKSLQN